MNQGILYRYSPENEEEEAQLVVPAQERERILQEYHDALTAGHYGVENTYKKISSRYYFQGMKKFISEYIKTCPECNRYKPTNQKPAGLLRTPAYAQRFETLAIDLFGPLPETPTGKKWIFIVEDTSTKWVELFALAEATAENCAKTLIKEVLLRYGLPRRLISDNGPQFISAVMQLTCDLLEITQDLIPVYHPQANSSECKNRDLKPRLAILVGEEHSAWEDKLPLICFAMNTSVCDTTGHAAAYLQFGRQLRTSGDIRHDIRQVIDNDNFVPEITPYLKRFANSILDVKDRVEQKQDCQKENFNRRRRRKYYKPGDKVWVTIHPISLTHEIADPANPDQALGTYHVSGLKDYQEPETKRNSGFVAPLRKRGCPQKKLSPGSKPRRQRNQRAHEQYGYCQAGTSGLITDDNTIVIGTLGPFTWRGTIFSNSVSFKIKDEKCWYFEPLLEETSPVDKYSYLGMSVTSGNFFNGKRSFVGGAPRSNGTGQFVFFAKKRNDITFEVQLRKICVLFWGISENTEPIKITGKPGSRYGFAVENAGDLNQDGFPDLAVGAPYEEGGETLYIYSGSEDGIILTPSQVIQPEDIKVLSNTFNQNFLTFGYSLNGRIYIDSNGYPDLLLGCYESNTIVLLRSCPQF
ncbi:integrin alpha-PS1 [Trichonephila clavipes]|nr:integrin alpha-PS1 [Trichonephila clavipes]